MRVRRDLVLVGLLGLLVRGAHLAFLAVRAPSLLDFPNLDEEFYLDWARTIAAGDLLGEGPFLGMPLVAYAHGFLLAVFGEGSLLVHGTEILLASLVPVLVLLLTEALFGRRAGLLAGILAVFYRPLLAYAPATLPASWAALLLAATLLLLERARAAGSMRSALSAGVLLGLLVLARAQFLALAPVAFVLLVVGMERHQGARIQRAAPLLVGFLLVLFPVFLRNQVVTGAPVLVSSNGGINFHIGNGRGANGIWRAPEGVRGTRTGMMEDARRIACEERGESLDPKEVSLYWYGRAFDDMRADPGGTLLLLLKKGWLTLCVYEVPNVLDLDLLVALSLPLRGAAVGYGMLLALACVGMVLVPRGRWRAAALPLAAYLLGAALLVAFFVNARFRVPLAPCLFPFAGLALDHGVSALGAGRRLAFAAGAAAVLVVVALLHVPPFSQRDRDRLRANSCILFGTSFRKGGESFRAEEMFEEATRLDPSSAEAYFDLGHVLQERLEHARDEGRALDEMERTTLTDRALSAYAGAREANPSHFKAALNLAILLLKERLGPMGNDPSLLSLATEAAGRAVELRPLDASARLTLGILLGQKGDEEGALDQYRKAYDLDPTNVRVGERIRALEKR